MEVPVPAVLAVDVFDKLNFTGAWVPQFKHLRGEVPKDLESSVFFSEDFFKPPERKGKAAKTRRPPLGAAGGGGRASVVPQGAWVRCRRSATCACTSALHPAACLLASDGKAVVGCFLQNFG